jgi:hypothetical protein
MIICLGLGTMPSYVTVDGSKTTDLWYKGLDSVYTNMQ